MTDASVLQTTKDPEPLHMCLFKQHQKDRRHLAAMLCLQHSLFQLCFAETELQILNIHLSIEQNNIRGIRNMPNFESTCFPLFNKVGLPFRLLVFTRPCIIFCPTLTQINDGIKTYWQSPCERSESTEKGLQLFPIGNTAQANRIRGNLL